MPSLVTDVRGSGCSVFMMVVFVAVVVAAVGVRSHELHGLSLLAHCPSTTTAQFHPQSLRPHKERLVAALGHSLCSRHTALPFSLSRSH